MIKKVLYIGAVSLLVMLIGGCSGKKEEISQNKNIQYEESQSEKESELNNNETQSEKEKEAWIIDVYYINQETGGLETKSEKVTNEKDIWKCLQEEKIITDECELISFALNEKDKKIDLDFNKVTGDKIRSMGTTGETEILACIIDTYLEAYNCNEIRLTEDGESFETGNGACLDGYSTKIEL